MARSAVKRKTYRGNVKGSDIRALQSIILKNSCGDFFENDGKEAEEEGFPEVSLEEHQCIKSPYFCGTPGPVSDLSLLSAGYISFIVCLGDYRYSVA